MIYSTTTPKWYPWVGLCGMVAGLLCMIGGLIQNINDPIVQGMLAIIAMLSLYSWLAGQK